MKKMKIRSMTKYLLVSFFFLGYLTANAQAPYINTISPTAGSVGETINVTGSNLTGVTQVYFGGALGGNLTVVNDNLLTVEVPFGATFAPLVIRHPSNGMAFSNEKFNLTFDGQSINDGSNVSANMASQSVFATNKTQTQDLCLCNFDGDQDLDVAVSNVGSAGISIFTNNSTLESAVFTRSELANLAPVTNIICGDIDGDGFPDLIANQLGSKGSLYSFLNDGTGNFGAAEEWELPTATGGLFRKPGRIALSDLDLDGKPEMLVAIEDENLVYYFENISTSGDINFVVTPTSLSASDNSGAAGLGGLDVADLNNDGLPDIIASNFTESGFYVIQNNSDPGDFKFRPAVFTDTNSNIRTLKTGDLNQDGFLDIVLTNSDISTDLIEIAANATGTAGLDVLFSTPIQIVGINRSWGLDLGDIDGDGDLDIAIASNGPNNGFYVVMNTNPSTIDVASYSVGLVSQSGGNNSRNILLADMDLDGRPDFAYTNNSSSDQQGKLAVRLNQVCHKLVIEPLGPTTLCVGDVVSLQAPVTGYSNYIWEKDGVVQGDTDNVLDNVSTSGDYTVRVTANSGCTRNSDPVTVTVLSGTYSAPTISISPSSSPCEGDDVTLTATPNGGAATYVWSGPDGFTSTSQNPTITGIKASQSGTYSVIATSVDANCELASLPLEVTVVTLPVVTVNNPLRDYFCAGSDLELSASEFAGYTYDWKLNGASFTPTPNTDPKLLTVTQAGDYSITISDGTCSYTSEPRTITTINPPTAGFTSSDNRICQDVAIDFTATSSGDLEIINTWDFGDGSANEVADAVSHAFSTAASYDVTVTARYDGIADTDCTYTPATSSVNIVAPPSGTDLDLIYSDNTDAQNFEKCAELELRLRVTGTYNSYHWVVGPDTVSTIAVADILNEVTIYANLVNADQCGFATNAVDVTNYTTGGIDIIAASPNTVTDDPDLGRVIILSEGQTEVGLSVSNTNEPSWEPTKLLSDSTTSSVILYPVNGDQLVKVFGIDQLGCQEKDSLTVIIPGIQADKSFTPNGDGIGDCWKVSNLSSTDCKVIIFDAKGRQIRDIKYNGDNSIDDCVWDGTTAGGASLPNGMYYYFISCSDSGNQRSGSIFMVK